MKLIKHQISTKNNFKFINLKGAVFEVYETVDPSVKTKVELADLQKLVLSMSSKKTQDKKTDNTKLANKLDLSENSDQENKLAQTILKELNETRNQKKTPEKLVQIQTIEGLPPKPLIPQETLNKQVLKRKSILTKIRDFFNSGNDAGSYLARLEDSTNSQGFSISSSEYFA